MTGCDHAMVEYTIRGVFAPLTWCVTCGALIDYEAFILEMSMLQRESECRFSGSFYG